MGGWAWRGFLEKGPWKCFLLVSSHNAYQVSWSLIFCTQNMLRHALFYSLNTNIEPKDLKANGLGAPHIPVFANSFCVSGGGSPVAAWLWLLGVSPVSEAQWLLLPLKTTATLFGDKQMLTEWYHLPREHSKGSVQRNGKRKFWRHLSNCMKSKEKFYFT